jgi:protein O-mannosyl-transferase
VLIRLTGAVWPPAFMAALFAAHPTHVESVAWIAERKDVLSAAFWLLTMWGYARYAAAPSPARYALVALALAAGLMAKPMLVTLPFALLLLDWWPLRRFETAPARRLVVEKLPLIALAAASSVITFVVQQEAGAVRPLEALSIGRRIGAAIAGYAEYFVEAGLARGPGAALPPSGRTPRRRRHPLRAAADRADGRRAVERATGAVRAGRVALVSRDARAGRRARPGGIAADRRPLHLHPVNDRLAEAHSNLGVLLARTGRSAEALEAFAEIARLEPGNADARRHLAVALAMDGRHEEAIREAREALRLGPDDALTHNALGAALGRAGWEAEALVHYQEAVRLQPVFAEAHANLGVTLLSLGRPADAVPHLQRSLALDARQPDLRYALTTALLESDRLPDALDELERLLTDDPDHAEGRALLMRLAERTKGR